MVRSLLIGRRKQWHVILAIVLVLFGVRVRHHWWLLFLAAATWPREMGSFCRYRKALFFWSLGISLYLELFCFLSFITIVLRNLCSGTHRKNREMSPVFPGVTKPPPKVNVVFLGSSPFLIWRCSKKTSIHKLHLFEMLYLVHWSWILENVFTLVSDSTLTYFKSFPLKCKRFCKQIKVTVQ